MCDTF